MQQHMPLTVTERLSQAIAAMAKAGYLKTNDAAGLKLMWSAGGELAQSIERAVLMEWDQGYAENVATLEASYDRHGVGSCLDVMPDLAKSRIVLLCNE
jgi:hypothetical protein